MDLAPTPGADPSLAEKVRALQDPSAYGGDPGRVEPRETHMSWVFLTAEDAWKLKKPVRDDLRDFSTPERRRANCLEEVRLNRPLAPGVYHGVVALTREDDGAFRLGGSGRVVDWLVHMRRLPAHRMLDRAIEEETAREAGLVRVAERLARFHETAPRAGLGAEAYRHGLLAGAETSRSEIAELHPEVAERVDEVVRGQEAFVERHAALLGARAEVGRVVEGHGDLRPEHVCLTEEPVIIDRLEFCRRLRLLDTASELAFLSLECERLGADWVGALFRRVHREVGGDDPPTPLLDFYRSLHACTRAGLALGHLRDGAGDVAPWIARAERYVERARECVGRALSA